MRCVPLVLPTTKPSAESDGEDPDWPFWYADYLREEASAALNADLSRDQLAALLTDAEAAPGRVGEDWTESS